MIRRAPNLGLETIAEIQDGIDEDLDGPGNRRPN